MQPKFDLYVGLRFWSAFTHGAGAVVGGFAGLVLMYFAHRQGAGTMDMVGLLVFTLSMVALYTASCLYHSIHTTDQKRLFLRQLDHSMIFVLIAGTYTPICLSVLTEPMGWMLLGLIWAMAILGVIVTLCWLNAPRTVTTLFYVGMGWTAILVVKPLFALLAPASFVWMLAGGVVYTIGGVLYALKWPLKNHPTFGAHEIFHLFILAGSFCFYMMMWSIFVGV